MKCDARKLYNSLYFTLLFNRVLVFFVCLFVCLFCFVLFFFFYRRIAGLNEKRAKAIVTWREENGAFVNREQLKEVKGIGVKSYEQCVGFVRIMNTSRLHGNPIKPSASGHNSTAEVNNREVIVVLDSDEEEKTTTRGKKRKGGSTEEQVTKKKKKKTVGKQELCSEPLDMTWIHPESYPVAKR